MSSIIINQTKELYIPGTRFDECSIDSCNLRSVRNATAEDYDKYSSKLRSLTGTFCEIIDGVSRFCAETESNALVRTFWNQVSSGIKALCNNNKQSSLPELLNYKLHMELLASFKELRNRNRSPDESKAIFFNGIAVTLNKHSSRVLEERCLPYVTIREIATDRTPPSNAELESITKIHNELLINTKLNTPQHGFGVHVTATEFGERLKKPGTRLFLLELNGVIGGYYIAQNDISTISNSSKQLLVNALGKIIYSKKHIGWADNIGILNEVRSAIKIMGFNAYDLLDTAELQSARAHDIIIQYGEVREGEQANLAIASHERRFWQKTGIVKMHNGYPYHLLRRKTEI